MSTLLLLNGPNLGILGHREPEVYGTDTLADVARSVEEAVAGRGWRVLSVQRESEGELIHTLQDHYDTVGAIVNPGALMMAGWGLHDALKNYPKPWIEVHISNVWARESFRHESVLSAIASGIVVGFGTAGYRLAAQAMLDLVPEPRVS